jgi:hypothetical protein
LSNWFLLRRFAAVVGDVDRDDVFVVTDVVPHDHGDGEERDQDGGGQFRDGRQMPPTGKIGR